MVNCFPSHCRVRERSWESERMNRVHLDPQQQQQHQATIAALNHAALNRSWDIDKVPALDRNWELERARGMEMVHRWVCVWFVRGM